MTSAPGIESLSPSATKIRALVAGLSRQKRGERRLLMLQGFFDDSGSSPKDPLFVLAGFIADASTWEVFSDQWEATLRKEQSIPYFKMADALSQRGVFEHGWNGGLIAQRVHELIDVIQSHDVLGVSVAFYRADFDLYIRRDDMTPEFRDPYFFASVSYWTL